MASNAVNGSVKDPNGSYSKVASPTGQQSKASFPAKMPDSKKPEDDLSQRRSTPQPKAWTSGVNPITQRSNTPQSNGAGSRSSGKSSSHNTILSEKNSLDRQMLALHNSIGSQCNFITKAGDEFTGVMAGGQKSSDDYNVLFKMVKSTVGKIDNDQNGVSPEHQTSFGGEHAKVFPISSLARIDVPEKQGSRTASTNGASGSFRTDSDISGSLGGRERNLQRWEAPITNNVDMSLESAAGGDWDQFKANEQMFGVKSNYDENIYTTRIDRNNPQYAIRAREAERIAREIESDVSANPHIREERGHKDEGLDEESKYSGVARNIADYQPLPSTQPGRYMPPARRQQTPTTTNEAVVDSAIISSQIARPEATQSQAPKSDKVEPNPDSTADSEVENKPEIPKPEQKTQSTAPTAKDTKAPKQLGRPGVTENVEVEVLDSFRQFLASEKMKVHDNKRNRASQDKAVKLNDLKKFSKNFKLLTPVPKDLVPILAKDEGKQKQIVEKAARNAEVTDRPNPGFIDPRSQRQLAVARWEGEAGNTSADMSKFLRGNATAAQIQKGPAANSNKDFATSRATSGLSARLKESHYMHKAAAAAAAIPAPLPIRDTTGASNRASAIPNAMTSPQKSASLRGPPSATSAKFNAAAREFKPNPGASVFKPGTAAMASTPVTSSPTRSGSVTRSISPAGNPPKFFGDRKSFGKWGERPDPISTVKPTKEEMEKKANATGSDGKPVVPSTAQNGGFQYPYRTPPTWVPPPDGENGETEVKYYEAFDKLRPKDTTSPTHTPPVNPTAHQHQLPFHLQNGPHPVPQVHTPHQATHLVHSQPQQQHHQYSHGHHHYDDHHMRPSPSNSSHYPAPSPRMQNQNMNIAYQSPMPPPAQLYGQPVQYVMHPNPQMQGRQFSNGPQMVSGPGAHLAPMMVQQPSSGGYMPQPVPGPYGQIPMYAAGPAPQAMYSAPPQPPSGYPSPGRHAPMMVHQGSHQGHNQGIYLPTGQFAQPMYPPQQPPGHMPAIRGGFGSPQPHFAQVPYQQHQHQHHYPHQPRRTPSTGYAQPHQVHHHMPSQQGPPHVNGAVDMVDDGK